MVINPPGGGGGRGSVTPSTTCLTETTDCPSSDVSVITSISRKTAVLDPRLLQINIEEGPDVIQRVMNAHGHGGGPPPPPPPPPHPQQHTIVTAQMHQIPKHLQHMTKPLQVMAPLQLRLLVREKLMAEGIRLSAPPYTSSKVSQVFSCFLLVHSCQVSYLMQLSYC